MQDGRTMLMPAKHVAKMMLWLL